MAFALPALAIVGAGVSAYGAIKAGQAQSQAQQSQAQALNYQAGIAKNNQIIAEQNRDYALQAGQAQAQTTALKGRAVGGRVKASQAASGVDVNSGSFTDVQEAQREAAQLDVETVLNNADLSAYGYRVKGDNFAAEADLKERGADNAMAAASDAENAGYLKAAGGLLSSAGSLGGKWIGGLGTPSSPAVGPPLSLNAADYD